MLTRNSFYAVPKEHLANLLNHPSTFEVNGDLRIEYHRGTRQGVILLSDYLMPELHGPRPQPRPYVAIGTRAAISAPSPADLNVIRALLDRAARRLEV